MNTCNTSQWWLARANSARTEVAGTGDGPNSWNGKNQNLFTPRTSASAVSGATTQAYFKLTYILLTIPLNMLSFSDYFFSIIFLVGQRNHSFKADFVSFISTPAPEHKQARAREEKVYWPTKSRNYIDFCGRFEHVVNRSKSGVPCWKWYQPYSVFDVSNSILCGWIFGTPHSHTTFYYEFLQFCTLHMFSLAIWW